MSEDMFKSASPVQSISLEYRINQFDRALADLVTQSRANGERIRLLGIAIEHHCKNVRHFPQG